MRITFLGKGGSGKTTVASAFIDFLTARVPHVLAIDADINVHLADQLGLKHNLVLLGDKFPETAEYVKGNRQDLATTPIVATTPPSLKSRFIRPRANDAFLKTFGNQKDNITLLAIGSYGQEDVGHTCYHAKLNTLELVYHHLLDSPTDFVVADATAGVDNLGTSLFFAADLNIFVVEPSLKSLAVYKQYMETAKVKNLKTYVIVNKYTADDKDFITKHLPAEQILGAIPSSDSLRKVEQGQPEFWKNFVKLQEPLFERIMETAENFQKDWNGYYSLLLETHKQNSLEWWNDYYHGPVDKQLDPGI